MHTFADNIKKFGEFGIIEQVQHPLVKVVGLPTARPGELVVFENNQLGQVLFMEQSLVEVLVFSKQPLPSKMKVTKTGSQLSLIVNEKLLGRVVDPLGKPLAGISGVQVQQQDNSLMGSANQAGVKGGEILEKNKIEQIRVLDIAPKTIAARMEINEPLLTGVGIVDMLLPLGKGQRQLVVGDRKTGKTSFALSAIKSQVNLGSIGVYAAIGKQMTEIDLVKRWLEKENLLNRVVIVATPAHDPQSLIYLSPFAGMAIAEYFRDQGKNVILVLDDLSTHAKYYREITLLAGRFPGRDSYPGDIFYTHARLLERAGNYTHTTAVNAAISCFPLAETTENDLTDYIVSNLIGITDGHLLFDSSEFIKGRRPAINPMLSVTRVGRQTQLLLHQNVSQQLLTFMSEFERSQKFAHFGAELTEKMKDDFRKGELVHAFFNQPIDLILPLNIQLLFVGMVWTQIMGKDLLVKEESKEGQELFTRTSQVLSGEVLKVQSIIDKYRTGLMTAYREDQEFKNWVDELMKSGDLYEMMDAVKSNKDKLIKICQVSES